MEHHPAPPTYPGDRPDLVPYLAPLSVGSYNWIQPITLTILKMLFHSSSTDSVRNHSSRLVGCFCISCGRENIQSSITIPKQLEHFV